MTLLARIRTRTKRILSIQTRTSPRTYVFPAIKIIYKSTIFFNVVSKLPEKTSKMSAGPFVYHRYILPGMLASMEIWTNEWFLTHPRINSVSGARITYRIYVPNKIRKIQERAI
ncbi:hypothetical protein SKAU_G00098950 [Synaphobranchus kaupii]|uniref:Uncharacterized protein n=1 Tax=Synaphobranchus kaupii TaxID=118154 RepID=A0A9Q1FYE2_SYNKA|nr:hypothetical protein SKAU_G00098950 [Synaphobranchus kaupii]